MNPLSQHLSIGNSIFAMRADSSACIRLAADYGSRRSTPYQYQIAAHDPNGMRSPLLMSAPKGMTGSGRQLNWAPASATPAQVSVVLRVYNIFGASALQALHRCCW
jgi:hypothetical protein